MAEESAARLGAVVWLLILCAALPTADSVELLMPQKSQKGFLNDNVTIPCKVLQSPDSPRLNTTTMGLIWYLKNPKTGEELKVFELRGDKQNPVRYGAMVSPERLKRGDASLHLPGVQLGDAGEYQCKLVVTPQMVEGRVRLQVVAKPVSTMFLEQTVMKGNDSHLVCHSSGFYPEAINHKWKKWTQKFPPGQEISQDISTGPTVQNEDNTFNFTSYLKLNASLEDSGTTYQCSVLHPSLHTSQKLNFTLPVGEAKMTRPTEILIFFPIGLIFMFCFVFNF